VGDLAADRTCRGSGWLLIRLHHAIADGIAALALLAPLFDPVSGAQAAGATPLGNPGDSTRPGALTSAARHRMARPRINVLVSNVPGPPAPLYFAGAAVRELFQLGVVQGNLALDVGVLSYAGQLNFDIVVDADVIPDVTAFTEGLADTLQQLGADRPRRLV
jgi:diacylglycerol O-acyltransferase